MVDPGALAFDTVGNIVVLILPALLWFFLYRFVWEQNAVANDVGFGRLVFWLLLLGGVFATLANLPLVGLEGNVLAVNLGGALFPVVVSVLLLHRAFQDQGRPLALFMAGLVGGIGVAFLLLLLLGDSAAYPFALALCLAVPALALLAAPFVDRSNTSLMLSMERASFALMLTGGAVLLTFLTTVTVPGGGIESAFPLYLIAPIAVGVLAVLLAGPAFHRPARFGLTIAYATSTFGVLLGADLFRQPPLYASSGYIYSVGGAGALDLVALSGPLAMGAAFLVYWLVRKGDEPIPATRSGTLPAHLVNQSVDAYVAHAAAPSLAYAQQAARASAEQSRLLLQGTSTAPDDRPWMGLPVPTWVEGDQENLDSLSRTQTADPHQVYRALQTSRWLTRLGRDISRGRFAGVGRRAFAFGIDLVIVTAFGAIAWALIAMTTPPEDILTSLAFNTAALGFSAFAFVYFVVLEYFGGATVGKRLFHLEVVNRQMRRPQLLESLVRNVTKLVPLTIIGYGGAIATAFFLGAGGTAASPSTPTEAAINGVIYVFAVLLGLGFCALVSVSTILVTSERQRLGDYVAGTWVVREEPRRFPPPGVPVAAAAGPSG